MPNANPQSLHGLVGTGPGGFTRLLPPDPNQPDKSKLKILAGSPGMTDVPDTPSDKPDSEENLYVPAGYTYFGQFVDHDLTFDTAGTFEFTPDNALVNQRTPAFDLDCLYGPGPDTAPYMYSDGVRLVFSAYDLPRNSAPTPRAIIGDPRNDENSIVCNLQMAFIRFHNRVVDKLSEAHPELSGKDLFERARNEVRWTYQRIVVEDYLPRIVSNETLKAFETRRAPDKRGLTTNPAAYALYTVDKRGSIPLEFSGAAYRFGHSMVRTGYRLNANVQRLIFADPKGDPSGANSLVGFQPLHDHVITDWSLFLPNPQKGSASVEPGCKDASNGDPTVEDRGRMQYAYRSDTTFVNPLATLPESIASDPSNLGLRNLMRGCKYQLASGQAVSNALGVPVLDPKYLVVRQSNLNKSVQTFVSIDKLPGADAEFLNKTPLWFYILAEAQQPVVGWWIDNGMKNFSDDELLAAASGTATQLGETGGRIVLEVFHGLLDADPTSYRNASAADGWKPMVSECRLWNLVNF